MGHISDIKLIRTWINLDIWLGFFFGRELHSCRGEEDRRKIIPSCGKQALSALHNLIACDHNAVFPEQQGYPFPSCTVWPYARCAFCTPCSCSRSSLS